jgi:ribonuclease D
VKSVETPREERVRDGREWQIKGSRDLKGVSLTVLKNLWYWRDHEAQRRDRPSFKVVNTDVLIDVAKWAAEHSGQDVATMPKAPSNVRRDYRDIMNRLVREAEAGPQAVFVVPPKSRERQRWGNAESKRMDELKKVRDEITEPLKIHASLVSTNAMLEDVAMARPKTREALRDASGYMEWQLDLVEERFLKITNEI